MTAKACFAPVTDSQTRILILGSLPGDASLKAAQYYAHPANQFWRLTGHVIDRDLIAMPYPDRLGALQRAGIGLWDVIQTAQRSGSLDSNMREIRANPLIELIRTLPRLCMIGFNGARAATIGRRQLGDPSGLSLVNLPSSSAAFCTMTLADKRAVWALLRAGL